MSRRSHRARHGHRPGPRPPGGAAPGAGRPTADVGRPRPPEPVDASPASAPPAPAPSPAAPAAVVTAEPEVAPEAAPGGRSPLVAPVPSGSSAPSGATPPEPVVAAPLPVPVPTGPTPDAGSRGCTAAQLRRFIKSRSYVPLHELRRRFELNGHDDEVNPVHVDGRTFFVGLPPREASLLGELLGQGDIGFELLLDPASPLIVGVYPMRPVTRV